MLQFQGIRILPKGTRVFQKDFPVGANGENLAQRPNLEVVKSPYILETYNPLFKESMMLIYDLGGQKSDGFCFEGPPVLQLGKGKMQWLKKTPTGFASGELLTREEKKHLKDVQYRIIDGADAVRFVEHATGADDLYDVMDQTPTLGERYKNLPDLMEAAENHDWDQAKGKNFMQLIPMIEQFLLNKWFHHDRSLGEKISAFIEAQRKLAAKHASVSVPVTETRPKTIRLDSAADS